MEKIASPGRDAGAPGQPRPGSLRRGHRIPPGRGEGARDYRSGAEWDAAGGRQLHLRAVRRPGPGHAGRARKAGDRRPPLEYRSRSWVRPACPRPVMRSPSGRPKRLPRSPPTGSGWSGRSSSASRSGASSSETSPSSWRRDRSVRYPSSSRATWTARSRLSPTPWNSSAPTRSRWRSSTGRWAPSTSPT